jgi:NADH-quinone oxidoreductase subunit H
MILDVGMYKLFFLVLITPLSLFLEGIRRKLLARMQNRIGPPVWQPFYDILKLFEKGKSDSKSGENVFFRTIPFLYFVATFALFLFVPFPIVSFRFDFIMFIYILILGGALYILVGIASNSPFGVLGSMRETLLMVCYEIIFAITILTFLLFAGVQFLSDFNRTFMLLKLPIASACLFVIALLESKITPFDTVEAQTEIMGSVETEYSGRSLAFLEISKCLKLTFFVFLTSMLFFGFKNLLFFITSLGMLFVFTFMQATTCRYRVDQVFRILIVVLLFAVVELIRINYIVW